MSRHRGQRPSFCDLAPREQRKLIAHLARIVRGRAPVLARPPSSACANPTMREHRKAVVRLARRFAQPDWAALAGYAAHLHDLGKYNPAFQRYLMIDGPRTQHSIVGAIQAVSTGAGSPESLLAAYAVAGHHGALPNWSAAGDNVEATLEERLAEPAHRALLADSLPLAIRDSFDLAGPVPSLPAWVQPNFGYAMLTRMVFSALLDADRLHSEQTGDPATFRLRRRHRPIAQLLPRLDRSIARMRRRAAKPYLDAGQPLPAIFAERDALLNQCTTASLLPPGVYGLTASTGLGKTLSGLRFCVGHAAAHGMSRVIYVAPYTSIIEQTAQVFRGAVGKASVVEHHSSLTIDDDPLDIDAQVARQREELSRENWSAPIIVTTAVQFFESLFAARTRRARKLHRVARSVIFIDEVQFFPPPFLRSLLKALRELVEHYGVTVVLSSATQADLSPRPWALFEGLPKPHEIVDDVPGLFSRMSTRTAVQLPQDLYTPVAWGDLADRFAQEPRCLAIVNTRAAARDLYQHMDARVRSARHLSASMCAAHRSDVLDEVRALLIDPSVPPIHLVSTSLIEAGVDIDFPVVFRALAGLDSLAQAAGRCNREGKLASGHFEVFLHPDYYHPQNKRWINAARSTIHTCPAGEHPFSPANFVKYFNKLHGHMRRQRIDPNNDPLDEHRVLTYLAGAHVQFREAERAMRLIDDNSQSVLVPYGDVGRDLCAEFKRVEAGGWGGDNLFARSQRFVVNLRRTKIDKGLRNGQLVFLEKLGIYVSDDYDPTFGLLVG